MSVPENAAKHERMVAEWKREEAEILDGMSQN
jgi:hypothetical protein